MHLRLCIWCGTSIEEEAHRNRKYCSSSCAYQARYKRTGQRTTPGQRSVYYKQRCLKRGYRNKLRIQTNARNHLIKLFLAEYKLSKGCKDCDYKKHHAALDFDHVRGVKLLTVCLAKSITQAKKEIKKCDVVCSNCHRIRTYKRYHEKKGFN